MHKFARRFIQENANKLTGRVIEIGSLDVNGGIRDLVTIEVGVDMRPGIGVDLVCKAEDLLTHYRVGEFDACVSLDTLEHVEDWAGFVKTSWELVKEGGWLVMTMASMLKGRHAYPDDYWRLTEGDIKAIYPHAEVFQVGKTSIGWVVKKEGSLGKLETVKPYVVP